MDRIERSAGLGACRRRGLVTGIAVSKCEIKWHMRLKDGRGRGKRTEAGFFCRGFFYVDVHHVALLLENDVVVLLDLSAGITLAEEGVSLEGVGESVPPLGQGLRDAAAGPNPDVEDPHGRVCEVLDRVDTVALPRDDLDRDLFVLRRSLRDLGGAEVAVAGLARLEMLGKVDPELKADIGRAVRVLARHLGVHDAPAGRHELQIARIEAPRVTGEVFMVDAALEEVGDGLLAAVRAGKPR